MRQRSCLIPSSECGGDHIQSLSAISGATNLLDSRRSIRTRKCLSAVHRCSQIWCYLVLFRYMKKRISPTHPTPILENTRKSNFIHFFSLEKKIILHNITIILLAHLVLEALFFVVFKLKINLNKIWLLLCSFLFLC